MMVTSMPWPAGLARTRRRGRRAPGDWARMDTAISAGGLGADVQAHGGVHPVHLLLGEAVPPAAACAPPPPSPGADHAQIGKEAPAEDEGDALAVEGVAPGEHHEIVGVAAASFSSARSKGSAYTSACGEAPGVGELLPVVDDRHVEVRCSATRATSSDTWPRRTKSVVP